MNYKKKIFLAGIKPTGTLHIGNYFGFLLPFKKIIENNNKDIFILYIADLHSIVNRISVKNKNNIVILTKQLLTDLYCMFNMYNNVYIFLQSWITNIADLSYIFTDFMYLNDIFLFHTYKQYKQEHKNIKFSVIYYPFLMASDILSLNTDYLVVSYDQLQHLEIARRIARKFNILYGNIFNLPEIYDSTLLKNSNILLANDGKKMSKSNNNCLDLFANKKDIIKYIMSIKTCNEVLINDEINYKNNLLYYLLNFLDKQMYENIKYKKVQLGYEQIKKYVIKKFLFFIKTLNGEKRETYLDNIDNIFLELKKKSSLIIKKTITKINKIKGIFFYK
jgi:tryptophanyl-tRNA synthetase